MSRIFCCGAIGCFVFSDDGTSPVFYGRADLVSLAITRNVIPVAIVRMYYCSYVVVGKLLVVL